MHYDYHYSSSSSSNSGLFVVLLALSFVAAWITHIIWIVRVLASNTGATVGQMFLGAIGAFFPPIGVIHGYMIWFGVS